MLILIGKSGAARWQKIIARESFVLEAKENHNVQQKRETANISTTLFERLSSSGLTPVEIPRLIRDLRNIIHEDGDFTAASVNSGLERLGWKKRIMDEFSFELIISILENEYDYEAQRHSLH